MSVFFLKNSLSNNSAQTLDTKIITLFMVLNFSGVPIFIGFFTKLPILALIVQLNSIGFLLIYLIINFFFSFFYLQFFKNLKKLSKYSITISSPHRIFSIKLLYIVFICISLFSYLIIPITSIFFSINFL